MRLIFELVAVISFLILFYVYIAYPCVLYIVKKLSSLGDKEIASDNIFEKKTVTIVIPAHNEEAVIAQKLENHLSLDYPKELTSIIVLNDTSNDATGQIATEYAKKFPGLISVFDVKDGKGKTNAINQLMPTIRTDITVFSDANVMLDDKALMNIVKALAASNVGGVAGQLTYVNSFEPGAAYSNGLYWRYEESIKKLESDTGSMMGADGSIFAIKTNYYRQLDINVLDDFSTSVGVICQNQRLIFSTEIKAYEKGAERGDEEFYRKIRISNRSFNTFRNMKKEIVATFSYFDLIKLYSHKVLRWYSFVPMFCFLISSAYLSFYSDVILTLTVFQIFAYVYSYIITKNILDNKFGKIGNIVVYFIAVNFAAFLGWYLSITGKKITTWKKAESTR
ncbi:glycosyltransferase [Catenovulum sp. SX2]|uniref:glycosyltransferase n=1 Tax=Catenovulum sp. SX2 TaxID=3398614 RepID=UPI003F85ACFB